MSGSHLSYVRSGFVKTTTSIAFTAIEDILPQAMASFAKKGISVEPSDRPKSDRERPCSNLADSSTMELRDSRATNIHPTKLEQFLLSTIACWNYLSDF